jgi:hypothetical protein
MTGRSQASRCSPLAQQFPFAESHSAAPSLNQSNKRNHEEQEEHEEKKASGGREPPDRCDWIDLLVALLVSGGPGYPLIH